MERKNNMASYEKQFREFDDLFKNMEEENPDDIVIIRYELFKDLLVEMEDTLRKIDEVSYYNRSKGEQRRRYLEGKLEGLFEAATMISVNRNPDKAKKLLEKS